MWYGNFAVNATVTIPWSTNSKVGDAVTRTTDGAIRLYKGNAVAQRTSANGITDAEDFDGIVGCHMLTIDLSDNTDAGFYTAGSVYHVMLTGAVIDTQTVATWLGSFAIGPLIGNVTEVAGATVNAAAAQLGVNVVTQANIDFGALQKLSLDAATPASVVGSVGSVTGLTNATIAAALGLRLVEGPYTYDDVMRINSALLAGLSSGGGTPIQIYRSIDDTADRATVTTTTLGNRTLIVLTP